MSEKHLHIISLDVPWPANYGGVIDIYYKAKALSEAGVKVHLHCFEYGRGMADHFDFCYQVHYYKRDTSISRHISRYPYIVVSRKSEELVENLLKDNYPILCEGLHTTAVLMDRRLSDRKVFVRTHNIEHDYYMSLAKAESVLWKKIYFNIEAFKLRHYEDVLRSASAVFAISQKDTLYFSSKYKNVQWIPAFSGFAGIQSLSGKGSYVLYHGNLSVRENEEAAIWLIQNVFSKVTAPCIIAGLNPSKQLVQKASLLSNVSIRANLPEAEMSELIQNAHVNVMVTNQPTGLKLKLLNALSKGRYCVVNSNMLAGTYLEDACGIADKAEEIISEINRLMTVDFTRDDIEKRQRILLSMYNNSVNAENLSIAIFTCETE